MHRLPSSAYGLSTCPFAELRAGNSDGKTSPLSLSVHTRVKGPSYPSSYWGQRNSPGCGGATHLCN